MTINCSGYAERPHLSYVYGLFVQGEMVVSICVYMFVVGFWTFRRDSHEWTLFKSPHIISYILSYCMYQVLSYHMIYIMFVSFCLLLFSCIPRIEIHLYNFLFQSHCFIRELDAYCCSVRFKWPFNSWCVDHAKTIATCMTQATYNNIAWLLV